MKPASVYAVLSEELAEAARLPAAELSQLADGCPFARSLDIDGERIDVELEVRWQDRDRTTVRITAHARGASSSAISLFPL